MDVLKEATTFVKEADKGKKDYLYLAGKKLHSKKVMLVSAKASDFRFTKDGKAISCRVSLSFKQCQKGGSVNVISAKPGVLPKRGQTFPKSKSKVTSVRFISESYENAMKNGQPLQE